MADPIQSKNSEFKADGDTALPVLMRPWVAVELLELCVGGSVIAKEVIADKMRDGVLKAYAKTISVSRAKHIKLAWSDAPAFDGTMKIIPKTKLIGSAHWAEDARNWKWRSGRFHLRRKVGGFLLLRGVSLVENDVMQLIRRYDERIRNLNKGGRGIKENAWYNMWLTVLWMQNNDQLNKTTICQKQVFAGEVMTAWNEKVRPELKLKYEGRAHSSVIESRLADFPSASTMSKSLAKLWDDRIA